MYEINTFTLFAGICFHRSICFNSYGQNAQFTIQVSGIKSGKGQLVLNIFKDSDGYEKERPYKKIQFDKKSLSSRVMTLKCSLDIGIYGITLLDDENANGSMDKSFIGIPKEGFRFSNFFMEKLKKPSFDDFKLQIKESLKIEIKVKYM